MTSSWFFLSTLNYDARSTTHQIYSEKILPRHYGYWKAVPRQVDLKYFGRLLLDNEERCTWHHILMKVIHLNILEENFCLFHEHVKNYLAHLNSSVSLKTCLVEKFCIHDWIQHKSTGMFTYWSSWDKKKLNFVDQCYPYRIIWFLGFIHHLERWKKNTTLRKMNVSKLNSTHTHQIWLPVVNNLIPAIYATSRQICFWPAWTSTR